MSSKIVSNEKRFVYAVRNDRIKLMEKFQCTAATVSESLSFKFNSALQREIRVYALNYLDCPLIIKQF